MTTSHFHLTGLTCGACVKLIQKKLGRIQDVLAVQADLTGAVTVSADREIAKEEILSALTGTQYLLS